MSIEPLIAGLALDAIDVPIYVVDREMCFVAANSAYRALCIAANLDPAAPVGFRFADLFPSIADRATANFNQVFSTGEPFSTADSFELNGRTIHAEVFLFPIRDGSTVTHIAVIARDVSEQRALEVAARDSDETARALMNASTAIMIFADNEGRILDLNEPAAAWFGRPAKDVIGQLGQEIASPEWVAAVTPYFVDVLFRQQPVRFQFPSGDLILDTSIVPIVGREGYVERFAIFASDITQQSRAMDEIRESEERFRIMADSTPTIIWVTDTEGNNIFVNRAYREFVGGPVDAIEGNKWKLILHPEDAERYVAAFAESLRTRTPFYARTRLRRHDGAWRWVDSYGAPRFSPTGEFLGIAGSSPDVTERELAEETIRQSEERFRVQFESIPVPTYIWEKRGDDTYMAEFNAAAMEFTRGGVAKFLHASAREMHVDNPQIIEDLMTCATEHVRIRRQLTYQFRYSPITTFLDVHYVPVPPNRVLVHTVDLTERVRTEEQLRESRQAYRDLVENVNDILYSVNVDGIITYVSPAIKRLLDYDPIEVIGRSVWTFIHPDDVPQVQAAFTDVLNNVLYPSEYRLVGRSGESHWMQTSSRPIMGENGVVGLRGVAVDITARKVAEEQLREAHRELESRVAERTEELARANEQLQIERETLERKNLVLQELVAQIETSRHHAALQILANIERVVMPIIGHLEGRLDSRANQYVALLKQTLGQITAPFAATLDSAYRRLTPVEIEICNLIRQGYGSKQIAELRSSSVQTVVKQRKIIRRKLGIDRDKVNLSHYLTKLASDRPFEKGGVGDKR